MSFKFKAMVLSCIDPRFQHTVNNHLIKKKLKGKYSSFIIAGSAIGVTSLKFKKWHKSFWDNIDISIKLHKIQKLIVFNHNDCGAAKIVSGKKNFDKKSEEKIHKKAFIDIKKLMKKKYPKIKIELNLISSSKKIQKYK